jgi:hypothetical protein
MLGRMAFGSDDTPGQIPEVLGLEIAPRHWGYPQKDQPAQARLEDLLWLRRCLPIALDLYQDDRFQRAYSIYDEALSSPRKELVAVLIWTAIEILFDASSEQHKTRAICEGVSSWIGREDNRDYIYNLTRTYIWNVAGWYMSGGRLRLSHNIPERGQLFSIRDRVSATGQQPCALASAPLLPLFGNPLRLSGGV